MTSDGFLLFTQVVLSLIILTLCYFVIIFILSHQKNKNNQSAKPSFVKINHIAIIYKSPVTEKEFIKLVNNLLKLNYTNYKAYFVSNTNFMNHNYSGKFLVYANQTSHNAVEVVKPYLSNETDAVLILEPNATLNYNFLNNINQKLNSGFEVIQSKIKSHINGVQTGYLITNDALYDFIDRKLSEQLNLPVSIHSFGYTIKYELFKKIKTDYFLEDAKILQAELSNSKPKQGFSELAEISYNLNSKSAIVKTKLYHLKQILNNQKLGLYLLFEGITKSNLHKIYFGFQYLRPPLFLIIICCIFLIIINIFFYHRLIIFSIVALSVLLTSACLFSLNIKRKKLEVN